MPTTPPADWFVVRGGLFADPVDLLQVVEDAVEDGYGPTVSVFAGQILDGETFEVALERVCRVACLRHGRVRVSTVGKLREAGFSVEIDTSDGQPDCHHNVVFTEPLDIGQAKLFVECFEPPQPNPAKG